MRSGFCDFEVLDFSYFDYAATTFMPKNVIAARNYYENNICISASRGKSSLSQIADEELRRSRSEICNFFSKNKEYNLIFYRGATYALNEIARSITEYLNAMDIILIGPYEHHSNYLPWREIAKEKGAIVFEMPLLDDGSINIEYLHSIRNQIKVISFSSVSNTNGFKINLTNLMDVVTDDIIVIVDDSQRCAHDEIEDNNRIDCHVLNSHKMYGPKGIAGALISNKMLNIMKPCVYGGGMIERIGFPNVWKEGISAFEAGTIDVSGIVGWREACKYIENFGYSNVLDMERKWHEKTWKLLSDNKNIQIVSCKDTTSLLSFYHKSIHAHDLDDKFSNEGIILRTGHICSQNSIVKFDMKPIIRVSFGISTDENDIENLVRALEVVL